MNMSPYLPFQRFAKSAARVFLVASVIGFLEHQAFGLPLLLEHWLGLRKEQLMAATNFQYFGLCTLGLSGLVVIMTALGRNPVLSGRFLRQSSAQVINIGSAFVGVIVGLTLSVTIKQGFSAASTGFVLALLAVIFIALVLGLSSALLQFPTMTFRTKWAESFRKEITVAIGAFVFLVALWGLGAELITHVYG